MEGEGEGGSIAYAVEGVGRHGGGGVGSRGSDAEVRGPRLCTTKGSRDW